MGACPCGAVRHSEQVGDGPILPNPIFNRGELSRLIMSIQWDSRGKKPNDHVE
jgi:hypothetical protein